MKIFVMSLLCLKIFKGLFLFRHKIYIGKAKPRIMKVFRGEMPDGRNFRRYFPSVMICIGLIVRTPFLEFIGFTRISISDKSNNLTAPAKVNYSVNFYILIGKK